MFTKDELNQLKGVVEEVLEEKLEQKLESKLEQKLEPIHKQLKQLKPMSKKINQLKKDQNAILGYLDKDIGTVKKRVDRIENHLHLPSSI